MKKFFGLKIFCRFSRMVIFAFLFLLWAGFISAFAQEPVKIQIWCSEPTATIGKNFVVNVDLKNETKLSIPLSITIAPDQAEFRYNIKMFDADGNKVPYTTWGRALYLHEDVVHDSDVLFSLKPGEVRHDSFILNKVFDVNLPGEYMIRVSREIYVSDHTVNIKSNLLKVKFAP